MFLVARHTDGEVDFLTSKHGFFSRGFQVGILQDDSRTLVSKFHKNRLEVLGCDTTDDSPNIWAPIIDVIMNGLRSLKRLVLHGRGVDADRESEWFEEGADRCLEWNDQLSLLFVSAECDVIGIAISPSFMVSLVHVCR